MRDNEAPEICKPQAYHHHQKQTLKHDTQDCGIHSSAAQFTLARTSFGLQGAPLLNPLTNQLINPTILPTKQKAQSSPSLTLDQEEHLKKILI